MPDKHFGKPTRNDCLAGAMLDWTENCRLIRVVCIILLREPEWPDVESIPLPTILWGEVMCLDRPLKSPSVGILPHLLVAGYFGRGQAFSNVNDFPNADPVRDENVAFLNATRSPREVYLDGILFPGSVFFLVPIGVILWWSDGLEPEVPLLPISQQFVQAVVVQGRSPFCKYWRLVN
jgi:hypothetical protein